MYNGNHAIVGILQNNPEENFGLQTLQGTRLVLSTEVDKSFSLPPTTFNQVQLLSALFWEARAETLLQQLSRLSGVSHNLLVISLTEK